jgi:hypothetical protein
MLTGLAFAALLVNPAHAEDKVKIGFITKFPVPFYTRASLPLTLMARSRRLNRWLRKA